jgi:preprotein translocase subunit SecG
MITFLTVVYVIVCVFLILVVLLQAGKGGGMGSSFGGSSQSVFGGAGAGNFLTRLTVVMASAFMLLSASLSYLSSGSDKALENAAKAIKVREDAQHLSSDAKKKAAATKGEQSVAPASTPEDAPGAAPIDDSPVNVGAEEAVPAAEAAPPAAAPEAMKAVDDALAQPEKKPAAAPRALRPRAPAPTVAADTAAPSAPAPAVEAPTAPTPEAVPPATP